MKAERSQPIPRKHTENLVLTAHCEWNFVIQVTSTMNTRPDMKRKHMNTDKARWKELELRTLISEVGCGTNVQSKQTHVLQY